jgi:hypothetical protein
MQATRVRIALFLGLMLVSFANQCESASSDKTVPDVADNEFLGDVAFATLRYSDAIEIYRDLPTPTPSSALKLGISYLHEGDYEAAQRVFTTQPELTNSVLALEARFYALMTRIAAADSAGTYLFLDDSKVAAANHTLNALFSDTNTPPDILQIALDRLIDHVSRSTAAISPTARHPISEVIGSHISLLPGDSPVDQARKHALVLRFHAARKDSAAFCRAAQTLVRVPEAHRDDPVVLTAFKTLALGLYEYERTDAVMNGSIKATYAPHAAAARHYGIAYLSLAPHDQEFADWLGMEVCMNIFLQTSNPHYLIEAVSLAHPSADQLMALQNATGVLLGSASQRAVFGKDDEILVSSVFSSPHWDSLLSLTKLRDEELSILTEVRSAALRPTDWHELSGDAAQGAALVGGAVVLGKLNRDTFPNWMLHNVPGKQPAALHHQWLSKHLFGNRYAQLHRLFDSIGKGTGYYHRILGGHDLGWLLRNLRSLANTEIAGVGKVGYRRAVLVWLQHMSQDLFSPKGIPTPIITRATYLTSRAYAKYVLGLGTKKARTYALRAASKTCLTFVKLAKGANIALWVWAANDVYNMVRDFQADAELRSVGKEIQQAMDYGDMELACEKLRGMLAKRNVSVRKPARTFAMRITLARMYDMAGKKDKARSELQSVVDDCNRIEIELAEGMDLDGDPRPEDQSEELDKISRRVKAVLIHDPTFRALVACRALATEATLPLLDEAEVRPAVAEAVGGYHRMGDRLAKVSAGNDTENAWSAAVNYYRAARLATLHGHKDAAKLSEKAMRQIFVLKRYAGPVTRPLLDDLEANWCSELMPDQLLDVRRVDLSTMASAPSLDWYHLDLHSVTLGKPLMEASSRIRVELARRVQEDVEHKVLVCDTKTAHPDVECVLMNNAAFAVHPGDEFVLRIFKDGLFDKAIYDSSKRAAVPTEGKLGLFASMRDTPGLAVSATLRPTTPYIIDPFEVKFEEDTVQRLSGQWGVCDIVVDGRLSARIQTQKSRRTELGEHGWGIALGGREAAGFRVLGGDPAVVHSPPDAQVLIQLLSTPDIAHRLQPLLSPWDAASFRFAPEPWLLVTASKALDAKLFTELCTFRIRDLPGLVEEAHQNKSAVLRALDGDVLHLHVGRIHTVEGVEE